MPTRASERRAAGYAIPERGQFRFRLWFVHPVKPSLESVDRARIKNRPFHVLDFQLKATDGLRIVDGGRSIPCTVEMARLHFCYHQLFYPFILVLYDAQKHRAFWLDVQVYVDAHADEVGRALEKEALTITVRIPVKNKLTVTAIDRFRRLLLERTKQLSRKD